MSRVTLSDDDGTVLGTWELRDKVAARNIELTLQAGLIELGLVLCSRCGAFDLEAEVRETPGGELVCGLCLRPE